MGIASLFAELGEVSTVRLIMDRETGGIDKVVAVHDVGRAVNPQLCEGQIEGSVHMGLGYALSEDFPSDPDGRPTHMTLRSLSILRPKDVPPILLEAQTFETVLRPALAESWKRRSFGSRNTPSRVASVCWLLKTIPRSSSPSVNYWVMTTSM